MAKEFGTTEKLAMNVKELVSKNRILTPPRIKWRKYLRILPVKKTYLSEKS